MKTINKKYTFTEEDALAHATFYGYNPKVVDETKLDENGNVPLTDAFNEDGTPKYEQEYDMETMEVIGNRLDESGNPIRVQEPVDVYMDNPQSPVDFLSANFDEFVKDWFMKPIIAEADKQKRIAVRDAEIAQRAMLEAVEGGVKSKIETVIE